MRFAVAALVALVFALPVCAQDSADSARDRWNRMSEEERELMRQRFRELERLDPDTRKELVRQSHDWKERRRDFESQLEEPARRRLDELDPHHRRRFLRDFVFDRARNSGFRQREKLPEELLQQLEGADPLTRLELLGKFRRERREEGLDTLLGRFAEELAVSPEEVERWKTLDPEARRETLMQLGRRFIEGRVEALGLPEDVSAEEWSEMRGLSDRRFLESWARTRPGPEYRPEFLPPLRGGPGGRPPGPLGGPPGGPRSDGERDPAWRGIRDELRPGIDDWLEFRDLPPHERRMRVADRVRERVLQRIEESGLVAPEELESLRGLRGPRFVDAVRELATGGREPRRSPRGPFRPGRPRPR